MVATIAGAALQTNVVWISRVPGYDEDGLGALEAAMAEMLPAAGPYPVSALPPWPARSVRRRWLSVKQAGTAGGAVYRLARCLRPTGRHSGFWRKFSPAMRWMTRLGESRTG